MGLARLLGYYLPHLVANGNALPSCESLEITTNKAQF